MKICLPLLIGITFVIVAVLSRHFLNSRTKKDETSPLYISLMRHLCKGEFITTIGNAGFVESDNNLIVSSPLYEKLRKGNRIYQHFKCLTHQKPNGFL